MSFLNSKNGTNSNSDMYVNLESKKTLRPLMKEPKTIWVHKIPSLEETVTGTDGKPQVKVLRRFAQYACTSTGKGGVGCKFCSMKDPLWSMIKDEKTKYNKKGVETHFPKGVVHLLPVFEQETNSVKLLKGGNQLYEEMDKWHTSQPDGMKDLRRCDWVAWKTGKGLFTKYNTSRMDASSFEVTEEMADKAVELMTMGNEHLKPPDAATVEKLINLIQDEEDEAVNDDRFDDTSLPIPTDVVSTKSSGSAPGPSTSVHTKLATTEVQKQSTPVEGFVAWLGAQPEFKNAGLLTHVVPVLQAKLNGSIDYHSASAEKLAEIQSALSVKLTQIRGA